MFGIAVFMTMICIGGLFSSVIVFQSIDFRQGKIVITAVMLFFAAAFGISAYQCYKMAFRRGDTPQRQGTADLPAAEIPEQHAEEVSPTCGTVPDDFAVSPSAMRQEVPQETPVEMCSELMPKEQEAIPDEVKGLLWIKGEGLTYGHNMLNEPSLIDMDLEIRHAEDGLVQDIGYYPSYKNLKAENRYVYLNWLKDVTAPIPIGYVFIFYYGLERHLLFGKFEQAFDMIVKLRLFHSNSSFYAYSSDALLIAALYHKRPDMISKIDLNKATSKLSQFVVASLTGKIESSLLIENCAEVGFTNKRYIKSDYGLFKQALDEVLQERFGDKSYPVAEEDFLKCAGTFPLVLANYSLKLEERIANAPDLSTNGEYKKNVFSLLNEAHERVKAYKREERVKGDGAGGTSNAPEETEVKSVPEKYSNTKRPKCNCDGCSRQENCEYGHVIYDEITNERMTLFDKFMMLHTFELNISAEGFGSIATDEESRNKRLLMKLDIATLHNTLNYLQEVKKAYLLFGKCGRAYFNFMKMGDEIALVEEAIQEYGAYKKQERPWDDSKSNESEKPKEIAIQDYVDVQQEYDFIASHVTYSTAAHNNMPFSFEEEIFFKALIKAMKENKLWDKEGLGLTRLADGTFNVNCRTCYIGKVKLRNKMSIQVQRGSTQVKSYSITELAEVLDKIPAWIRYIKYCRRDQKIFDKLLET